MLIRDFTRQVFALRHEQTQKLGTLLMGNLEGEPLPPKQANTFLTTFNSAACAFNWHDIELNEGEYDWEHCDQQLEWSRSAGLKLCGGPLLRFYQGSLPDWLYLWCDDMEAIQSYYTTYIRQIIQRYAGEFRFWHCAAGTNVDEALGLTEEQRLRLTVTALEHARKLDSRTPLLVSLKQPWGEYLGRTSMECWTTVIRSGKSICAPTIAYPGPIAKQLWTHHQLCDTLRASSFSEFCRQDFFRLDDSIELVSLA